MWFSADVQKSGLPEQRIKERKREFGLPRSFLEIQVVKGLNKTAQVVDVAPDD